MQQPPFPAEDAQKGNNDENDSIIRLAALTGVVGAIFAALAAGPAVAGHGLLMKEHPLRGDFPVASVKKEVVAPAVIEAKPVARLRAEPGGWLRGDFPMAAESRPEPVKVVTGSTDETWTCSIDHASAQPIDVGAIQAVTRLIRLVR